MCNDCVVLHERLQEQSGEMFALKRAIIRLRGQLKHERRKNAELIKEKQKNQKPNLRKGQKRGHYGRKG